MKYKYNRVLKFGLLVLSVIILFVINPLFENKYRDAEKNVQIFMKEQSAEYESLLRDYEIKSEIIQFTHDSVENVITQKYTILKHELEMKKLREIISNDEYDVKYDEIMDLEIAEILATEDTLIQRMLRLEYPEEIKVPRYLLNYAKLYGGLDALIRFTKWLLFVVLIFFGFFRYFNNKTVSVNLFDQKLNQVKENTIVVEGQRYLVHGEVIPGEESLQAVDEMGNSLDQDVKQITVLQFEALRAVAEEAISRGGSGS